MAYPIKVCCVGCTDQKYGQKTSAIDEQVPASGPVSVAAAIDEQVPASGPVSCAAAIDEQVPASGGGTKTPETLLDADREMVLDAGSGRPMTIFQVFLLKYTFVGTNLTLKKPKAKDQVPAIGEM